MLEDYCFFIISLQLTLFLSQSKHKEQPRERYRLRSPALSRSCFSLTDYHPFCCFQAILTADSGECGAQNSGKATTLNFPFLTHAHKQSSSRLWKIVVSRRGGREKFDFFHFRSSNCVHFGSVFRGEKCEIW